jgi:hypothetical protein
LACQLTKEVEPSADKLALINASAIDDGLLKDSYRRVWKMYQELGGDDIVAKGPNLIKRLKTYVKRTVTKKARAKSAPQSR